MEHTPEIQHPTDHHQPEVASTSGMNSPKSHQPSTDDCHRPTPPIANDRPPHAADSTKTESIPPAADTFEETFHAMDNTKNEPLPRQNSNTNSPPANSGQSKQAQKRARRKKESSKTNSSKQQHQSPSSSPSQPSWTYEDIEYLALHDIDLLLLFLAACAQLLLIIPLLVWVIYTDDRMNQGVISGLWSVFVWNPSLGTSGLAAGSCGITFFFAKRSYKAFSEAGLEQLDDDEIKSLRLRLLEKYGHRMKQMLEYAKLFCEYPGSFLVHWFGFGGGWSAAFVGTIAAALYCLTSDLQTVIKTTNGRDLSIVNMYARLVGMYRISLVLGFLIPCNEFWTPNGLAQWLLLSVIWGVFSHCFWSPSVLGSLVLELGVVWWIGSYSERHKIPKFGQKENIVLQYLLLPVGLWLVGGKLYGILFLFLSLVTFTRLPIDVDSEYARVDNNQFPKFPVLSSMLLCIAIQNAIVPIWRACGWQGRTLLCGGLVGGILLALNSSASTVRKAWYDPLGFLQGRKQPSQSTSSRPNVRHITSSGDTSDDIPIPELMPALPIPKKAPPEIAAILAATNHYAVLGLEWDASEESIRRQKRLLSLATHPDKASGVPGAPEACTRVLQAAEVLLDETKKKEYHQEMTMLRLQLYGRCGDAESDELFQQFYETTGINLADLANGSNMLLPCESCPIGHHVVPLTERPQAAARQCDECKTRHPVVEGEIWIEVHTKYLSTYRELSGYLCSEGKVYEATELFKCLGYLDMWESLRISKNLHDNLFYQGMKIMHERRSHGRASGSSGGGGGGGGRNARRQNKGKRRR